MDTKISIVGGGVWGRALANTFANLHDIILYSIPESKVDLRNPRVEISYQLESLKESKYLFLVVPSSAVRQVCEDLRKILNDECYIIICSKGIETESGLLMSEVVNQFFPKQNIAVLSGPNFASEILNGLPAVTSIIAEDILLAREICKKFSTENFKLMPATNLIKAQLFGAVKNVLAILCGVAWGLKLGENFIAALVTSGMKEITQLAIYKDADQESLVLEPVGLGDIFLTCSSSSSRNYKFGVDLASHYIGKHYKEIIALENITVEGISTILALNKWNIKLPLTNFAFEIITSQYNSSKEITQRLKDIILNDE
ncbi:MAG: NAD(P)-binding domain-containing protein [Rickettsiales bacterium]|nr:NAD(P)-binding domain-containing protein [Rickettsiales bacterium]